MRKTYTILMPTMLPRHFRIVSRVFARFGYKTEPLEIGLHGDSRPVIDAGLKYVHNDACYPAILIVGSSSPPWRADSTTRTKSPCC